MTQRGHVGCLRGRGREGGRGEVELSVATLMTWEVMGVDDKDDVSDDSVVGRKRNSLPTIRLWSSFDLPDIGMVSEKGVQ